MYKIKYGKDYIKNLSKIPKAYHLNIKAKIEQIAFEPHRAGKKLKAKEGRYSARVGKYRIIYEPYGEIMYVVIYEIAHRKDVYKEN